MIKIKNVLYILFLTFSISINAEEWNFVNFKDIEFKISPKLEIQSGIYKKIMTKLRYNYKINDSIERIVIQPKKTNEFDVYALDRYCRFILIKLNETSFSIKDITKNEILELNDFFKNGTLASIAKVKARGMNLELISWENLEKIKINNIYLLKWGIIRKSTNAKKGLVKVNEYMFVDKKITYKLTVSYRINEKEIWARDLSKMINSLRIRKKVKK